MRRRACLTAMRPWRSGKTGASWILALRASLDAPAGIPSKALLTCSVRSCFGPYRQPKSAVTSTTMEAHVARSTARSRMMPHPNGEAFLDLLTWISSIVRRFTVGRPVRLPHVDILMFSRPRIRWWVLIPITTVLQTRIVISSVSLTLPVYRPTRDTYGPVGKNGASCPGP